MSRFLSIQYGKPTGEQFLDPYGTGHMIDVMDNAPGVVRDINRNMVADFRDKAHAIDFTSAVANETFNPTFRAPIDRRLDCHVCPTPIAGRWYVVSDESDDRLAVGIFAAREDADLFVRYMAR